MDAGVELNPISSTANSHAKAFPVTIAIAKKCHPTDSWCLGATVKPLLSKASARGEAHSCDWFVPLASSSLRALSLERHLPRVLFAVEEVLADVGISASFLANLGTITVFEPKCGDFRQLAILSGPISNES